VSRRSSRLQQQIAVFVRGAGADASVSDRARCREGAVPRRPGIFVWFVWSSSGDWDDEIPRPAKEISSLGCCIY